MKILRLLNKKNLSIIFIYLLSSIPVIAEDKPVDLWSIDIKESKIITDEAQSVKNVDEISESNIYKMQTDKAKDIIKLDQKLKF